MRSGIYYIQNINNSKLYVGSAVNISERWRLHRLHLNRGDHCNKHLQTAWNTYGIDSFIFGIVEVVIEKNKLLDREQYWIDHYEVFNRKRGYNQAPVAGSMLGYKHTEETKKKMTSCFRKGMIPWNKGKKMEGEYRKNFEKAMQSDKMKNSRRKKSDGFKHTEETKRKIGEAGQGRICSSETKKKKARSMTGKKLGESHRLNCIKAWEIRKLKTMNNKKED